MDPIHKQSFLFLSFSYFSHREKIRKEYYYYLKFQTEMIKSRITGNSVIKHIMECSSKTSKTALSMPETRESRFRGSLKIIIRFKSTNTYVLVHSQSNMPMFCLKMFDCTPKHINEHDEEVCGVELQAEYFLHEMKEL